MKITTQERIHIQTTFETMMQQAEATGMVKAPQMTLLENKFTQLFAKLLEEVKSTKDFHKCKKQCIELLKKQSVDKEVIGQVRDSFSAAKGMALAKKTLGFEIKEPNDLRGNFIEWVKTNAKDEKLGTKQVEKLTCKWEQLYDKKLGAVELQDVKRLLDKKKESLQLTSKSIKHMSKAMDILVKIDRGTQFFELNVVYPKVEKKIEKLQSPQFETPNVKEITFHVHDVTEEPVREETQVPTPEEGKIEEKVEKSSQEDALQQIAQIEVIPDTIITLQKTE